MSDVVEREVTLMDCLPIMLEKLKQGASVEFTAHGTSMMPLLHDSSVVISPKPDRLKLYDMPLYIRSNGAFVLHRIVRINKDGSYSMCGDNQTVIESPIYHKQVVGVVSAFDWNGVNTSVTDAAYLEYVKAHMKKQKRLRAYYGLRGCVGKILRKLHLRK
ncbi:MAG: S24/S26 family peptidase [Eubacteriales bacterium]|nr:S24/S26 family peptidase [Eubacteriales bacterium]